MKVFLRSEDLASGEPPTVIASYDDNASVPADAHGAGMIVVTVPANLIDYHNRLPRLVPDWRERAGPALMAAEADRRIGEVLSPAEQQSTLYEMIQFILQHGTDISTWPADAQERKADIDNMWNYVREVRQRQQSMASVPANPGSDKVWPIRVAKR
jgi:hypothetical protein